MRKTITLAAFFMLFACSTQMQFKQSIGYVSGWDRQEYFSVDGDRKIRFIVNNSFMQERSGQVLGIELADKKFNVKDQKGNGPLIVYAFFFMDTRIRFSNDIVLSIGHDLHKPESLDIGKIHNDAIICESQKEIPAGMDGFSIGNNQCIILAFDTDLLSTDETFTITFPLVNEVESKSGNSDFLEVTFSGVTTESISTH